MAILLTSRQYFNVIISSENVIAATFGPCWLKGILDEKAGKIIYKKLRIYLPPENKVDLRNGANHLQWICGHKGGETFRSQRQKISLYPEDV